MDADKLMEVVAAAIMFKSANCDRKIVGHREFNGVPIGGYAIVAPDCIQYVQPLDTERDIFIDFCLN
jgi:hypothetical protein